MKTVDVKIGWPRASDHALGFNRFTTYDCCEGCRA